MGSVLAVLVAALQLPSVVGHVEFPAALAAGEPRRIVCYGTSLTAACGYPEALQRELDRRWPGMATVVNSGGSGQNSRWGLENLDALVVSNRPDAVFLEFSMNDSVDRFHLDLEESERNTRLIIGRIRQALPKCEVILMTMNPYSGEPAGKRAGLPAYYEIYRKLAGELRLPLIDNFPIWQKTLVEDPSAYAKMVPDGTHPNDVGIRSVLLPNILKAILRSMREVLVEDVTRSGLEGHRAKVRGYIREVMPDESVPGSILVVLRNGSHSAYVEFGSNVVDIAQLRSLISADVTVEGTIRCPDAPDRVFAGPCVADSRLVQVNELEHAGADPYSAKYLENVQPANPRHILSLLRRRLTGTVLAAWGRRFLLKSDLPAAESIPDGIRNGRRVGNEHVVTLSDDAAPPRAGMRVETVGFPGTDLRRINLNSAIWRECGTTTGDGVGGLLELQGSVVDISSEREPKLVVKSDRGMFTVPLDACQNVAGKVERGSIVRVRGVEVDEIEEWHDYSRLPRRLRRLIVPRGPADVDVVKGIPWWTAGRLFAIIGMLFAALGLIVVKMFLDRHIAAMRLSDRTQLAVELHDSVSQNLTGVSMQIDAARELLAFGPDRVRGRLDIASRTIDSCREQLRNCICDLRSNALDQDDFGSAAAVALTPLSADSAIAFRFNVPRRGFPDDVVHSVISIVRELSVNAVRHGRAANIRVAGVLDAGMLRFSVSDDGCGFDVASRPGAADGHFGLDGVSRRVRSLGGTLEIESAPGDGCRVAVAIPAHRKS